MTDRPWPSAKDIEKKPWLGKGDFHEIRAKLHSADAVGETFDAHEAVDCSAEKWTLPIVCHPNVRAFDEGPYGNAYICDACGYTWMG